MKQAPNKLLIVLAFFSIYVIWGSTYLLNKIAVAELPPFMLAGLRFTTAGILIFVLCRIMRINIAITKKQIRNTIFAGFLFLCIGNGVVVWALRFLDSGFAALEISSQPLVVLLMLRILEGKKIKAMSWLGVFFGILGMYLLVSQRELISDSQSILGMIMIFFCLVAWSFGSIFVSKADLPKNYFVNTGYQMFSGGIILMFVSLGFGEEWTSPAVWSTKVLWSMFLLVIFGSIVAFTSFNYLLRSVSPDQVATSTYVNPIIALILGWYFLNEQVTLQSMMAAAVLLTGVYFINTKKQLVIFSRFYNRIRGKVSNDSDQGKGLLE